MAIKLNLDTKFRKPIYFINIVRIFEFILVNLVPVEPVCHTTGFRKKFEVIYCYFDT